jgi:hypothetical protein
MSQLSSRDKLVIQQKRDKDAQLEDIQNRQFELFLNGPSYVDLASALTPKKQIHYDKPYSEIKEHLHLFAEMLDRLIAERKS